MNNEHMPRYIKTHMEKDGTVSPYDPDMYTSCKGDTEYVRTDMLFEALADRGYNVQIIVTPKGEDVE